MCEKPQQRQVTWEQAPTVIAEIVAACRSDRCVIGISGPVGAGKTSLARRLGGTLISTDDYLPDYEQTPPSQRDEPAHADLDTLARHLRELREGRPAEIPIWSFHQHRRIGSRTVTPGPLIVCEGIFALCKPIREMLDLAVLVDAPPETRWQRWEQLETHGARGWGIEVAREHFDSIAEPTFARYAEEYRKAAHIIVLNHESRTLGT